MKYLVHFSRVFVGLLFIISGLIKLNDPVGFSFKLEEYFSIGVLDIPFLIPYALFLSVFMVILEVVLGVMLLIGFRKKFTLWSLLLMIVFFTFLTFYSAYFNKVTDCGCFGDAVKLTPWQSFYKDILLLVLILILLKGKQYIKLIFGVNGTRILVGASLLGCSVFAYYVLHHLPVVDFRPYKIGANIAEGMIVPEGAPKAIFDYAWKFKHEGKEVVIVTDGGYPDQLGEFVSVETTEIQKGYEPPIHDFTIERDGEDRAAFLLEEEKLIMIISYDLIKADLQAFNEVKDFSDTAILKGYKVIGMSASGPDKAAQVKEGYLLGFNFYFTDETVLKTIVRSNPGILVLEKGTITQKVHYNDIDQILLK